MIPITFVGYEDDVDLRTVTWNHTKVMAIQEEYDLADGEAILFRNVAQTKFRIVLHWHGITSVLIPPVDSEEKHSLDLKIIYFLRQFRTSDKKVAAYLKEQETLKQTKIDII